jgi:hypothetical protein
LPLRAATLRAKVIELTTIGFEATVSEPIFAEMPRNYEIQIARLETTVRHLDDQVDKIDKRFSEVNSRLDSIQQQIANLPKPAPIWVPTALIGLILAFGGGTIYYGIQFSGRIAALEARPVTQTSALLNDAVLASKTGSLQNAAADVENAAAQLQIARLQRLRPTTTFFQHAIEQTSTIIGSFEKSDQAPEPLRVSTKQFIEQLAAYRTDFNEVPAVKTTQSRDTKQGFTCLIGLENSFEGLFDHIVFNASGHPEVEAICSQTEKLKDNIVVADSKIVGGHQRLDIGVHFRNVVFVGTRIQYGGGELDIENVSFVNCTFEIPAQARGFLLAQYVVLNQKSLSFTAA